MRDRMVRRRRLVTGSGWKRDDVGLWYNIHTRWSIRMCRYHPVQEDALNAWRWSVKRPGSHERYWFDKLSEAMAFADDAAKKEGVE